MYFLQFPFGRAEGYNCNSSEKRAKFMNSTMKDYLHYQWNNVDAGQSPYKMFQGVLMPNGFDENGDVIYRYNTKATIQPIIGCSGCTACGKFIDGIEGESE